MTNVAWVGLLGLALAGCGAAGEERKGGTTPVEEASAKEPESVAISGEHFEEIDRFFRNKAAKLQFVCYNSEAERSKTKPQGNVSLHLTVVPGGKATDIKITTSTLNSPPIEQCMIAEMKTWSWPEVPSPAPYAGSVSFKPAW